MQAYAIKTLNGQAVVELVERAEIALGPTHMRIQMQAASLLPSAEQVTPDQSRALSVMAAVQVVPP